MARDRDHALSVGHDDMLALAYDSESSFFERSNRALMRDPAMAIR
jgi:hypothetical protein